MKMLDDRIVLIGGGGHCKSVLDCLLRTKVYREIVITDYDSPPGSLIMGCKVAGTDDVLEDLFEEGIRDAFITIGSIKSPKRRVDAYQRAKSIGFHFPCICDPSSIVAESATVGEGVFVGKNAVINSEVKICNMAIINTAAVIEHDCSIGEFTHIAVGAVVCGSTEVGCWSFVGANATLIQGLSIGEGCVIGAGCTVQRDLSAGSFVANRPDKMSFRMESGADVCMPEKWTGI